MTRQGIVDLLQSLAIIGTCAAVVVQARAVRRLLDVLRGLIAGTQAETKRPPD